jgi:hypothetical protein
MAFHHKEMYMRRPAMLALVFLGLATAFARPAAAQEFGLLGGVTFSDLTGDGVDETLDRSNGFLAGAFARVPLGQIITVQPEVQYVRKGAEGESVAGDFAVKLDYIDVPVFLSFGLPTSFGFHIMAGPNFSFEVGCNQEADTVLGEAEAECDDDDDEFGDRKSFISAVAVGAGIDLPLGGMGLFIDGRFVIDLESISENDGDAFEIKNQVFEIVAGLRFGR